MYMYIDSCGGSHLSRGPLSRSHGPGVCVIVVCAVCVSDCACACV
jgi:hypothetical protein